MENRNALELLNWLAGDFYKRLIIRKEEMVNEGEDTTEIDLEMTELKDRTEELFHYKKSVK